MFVINYIAKKYCLYKAKILPVQIIDGKDAPQETSQPRIHVLDESLYADIVTQGELGLGRGYVSGKWATDNLEQVMTTLTKYMRYFSTELFYKVFYNIKLKTRAADKKYIKHHYDVGNDFYELFLDKKFRAYSTGFWNTATTLESAIEAKVNFLISKLDISPEDRVLDIGCGWGLIGKYIAATTKNTNYTGVTVSDEQIKYIRSQDSPIYSYNKDYRDIQGKYDKILSIEMLEHVGRANYHTFFDKISNTLNPKGKFVLQITVSLQENQKEAINQQCQYILTDIYPGGQIPKISWILEALTAFPDLRLCDMQLFDGKNFAKTFRAWNASLQENATKVKKLELLRAYEYYFNTCVGLFENNILATCVFVVEKI